MSIVNKQLQLLNSMISRFDALAFEKTEKGWLWYGVKPITDSDSYPLFVFVRIHNQGFLIHKDNMVIPLQAEEVKAILNEIVTMYAKSPKDIYILETYFFKQKGVR